MIAKALFSSRLLRLEESTRVSQKQFSANEAEASSLQLRPNQVLIHKGDCSERAYVVVSGAINAISNIQTLHTFKSNDPLCLRSLLFPREEIAVTLKAGDQGATLVYISRAEFDCIFHDAFVTVKGMARGRIVRAKSTKKTMKMDCDIAEFRGIRFARAPRFKLPQIEDEALFVDALEFGPICPQPEPDFMGKLTPIPPRKSNPSELIFIDPKNPVLATGLQSEDCLFLNICAPLNFENSKFPVMVFIHGGAFEIGAGSEPHYSGRHLSSKGVVLVTINYRLGVLGFLAQVPGVVPNLGLHDQIAALRWVKRHINKFGGDANNITVFGESAGAISISCLLGTKIRREEQLFHRAILMSGAANCVYNETTACGVRDAFFHCLGSSIETTNLFEMPLEKIVAASRRISIGKDPISVNLRPILHGRLLTWQPCVLENGPDELLFNGVSPFVAVARGIASDVQMMSGVMDSEFTLFMLDSSWKRRFYRESEPLPALELRNSMADYLVSWVINDTKYRPIQDLKSKALKVVDFYLQSAKNLPMDELVEYAFERLNSVWLFDLSCDRLVRAHAFRSVCKSSTFAYRVTQKSQLESLRSPHALDLPLVFGTLDSALGQVLVGNNEETQTLSRSMVRSFIQFAKCGNPGFKSFPEGHVETYGPLKCDQRLDCSLFQNMNEKQVWDDFLFNCELSPEFMRMLLSTPASKL